MWVHYARDVAMMPVYASVDRAVQYASFSGALEHRPVFSRRRRPPVAAVAAVATRRRRRRRS